MSNHQAQATHPETGKVELADYLDDYFGRSLYGIRFPDGQVFPEWFVCDAEKPDHCDQKKKPTTKGVREMAEFTRAQKLAKNRESLNRSATSNMHGKLQSP